MSNTGQQLTIPVELNDIGASIANAAGVELNYKQYAKSLLSCLEDGHFQPHEAVVFRISQ